MDLMSFKLEMTVTFIRQSMQFWSNLDFNRVHRLAHPFHNNKLCDPSPGLIYAIFYYLRNLNNHDRLSGTPTDQFFKALARLTDNVDFIATLERLGRFLESNEQRQAQSGRYLRFSRADRVRHACGCN